MMWLADGQRESAVCVILCGGLGNQLFQYSAGRALSIRLNRKLYLNTSAFAYDKFYQRRLALEAFSTPKQTPIINSRIQYIAHWIPYSLYLKKIMHPSLLNYFGVYDSISPKDFISVKNWSLSKNIIGYFQDEEYFSECTEIIRQDLRPVIPMSECNEQLATIINRSKHSVSVHIRCNHEVAAHSTAVNCDLILSPNYYASALNYLRKIYGDLDLFVFTDNIDIAQKKFLFLNDYNSVFLTNNRGSDWEDLCLMSACHSNIIANSSFSWWGAWLGDNGKSIIAPANMRYTPVCPARWTIL